MSTRHHVSLLTLLLIVPTVACIGSNSSDASDPVSSTAASPTSPSNGASVEGLVAGLGGACPNLSFTVNAQHVVTNAGTRFDGAACSALRSGMQVEVEGVRQADGSIVATKTERKDQDQPAQNVEIKGAVAGLSGTCPTLAFSINGQRIVTDANTKFDESSCGALRNAMPVEVKGVRQTDGSVRATKVEGEDNGHDSN